MKKSQIDTNQRRMRFDTDAHRRNTSTLNHFECVKQIKNHTEHTKKEEEEEREKKANEEEERGKKHMKKKSEMKKCNE